MMAAVLMSSREGRPVSSLGVVEEPRTPVEAEMIPVEERIARMEGDVPMMEEAHIAKMEERIAKLAVVAPTME